MDTQLLFSDYVNPEPIIWPFGYFCVLKPWSPKSVSEVCSMTITRQGTFGATMEETAASHPSLSLSLTFGRGVECVFTWMPATNNLEALSRAFWVGKKWIKSLMKPWSLLESGHHQILSDLLQHQNSTILFVQLCTNILQILFPKVKAVVKFIAQLNWFGSGAQS